MKKWTVCWAVAGLSATLLLSPIALGQETLTSGLTAEQTPGQANELSWGEIAAHYWQGLGLKDNASEVTLEKGEYVVCLRFKNQLGYGKMSLTLGGDRMTFPLKELGELVGANISWQADSGLSTFQIGNQMAVFNTKLPLMYLGQKDEAGVVTYERSELPVTLTSQAGRLQVYLDVLYRLGMIPSWDAAAQQLTITLDQELYGTEQTSFAPSELVGLVATDLNNEIASRAEASWQGAFGRTRLQKDAASAGVGAGEYLLRATAGSSNAYGKIAVSGSKVPLKDLAPLLGAQITYDSVTGLTLYQAGNKMFALSPQISCLYVGVKASDGKVTYTKTYLDAAPSSIDSRVYVGKEVLDLLGVKSTFNTSLKVLDVTLEQNLYGVERSSFTVSELTNLIASDVAKEKEKDKLLAGYTTYFNTGNTNRSTNLRLAAKAINGTVISPGKSFSFNGVVGPRTTQKGYKEAIIFSGGKEIDGIGGGICQVSSTLYNAVLKTSLKVTERHTHSLPVAYVPKGKDATVAYGALDFKFQNNRAYPVTVKAYTNGGSLTVEIWGK